MASESIMIWRHPSPFTVWHASEHWLASSQSLRELTLFTAVSIAVFKPMETSMSKKRISRSTMDTCFKILQLKFDQKLANRCIGLAKHQWGLISILRHRRIINTSMVRSNTSVLSPWIKSSNCSQIKTRREFWANASSKPIFTLSEIYRLLMSINQHVTVRDQVSSR